MAAAALGLAQCDRDQAEPPATVEPATAPAPITAPSNLSRGDVVLSLNRAASAFAAGADPSDASGLAGRTFRIRQPFGCSAAGGTVDNGLAGFIRAEDRTSLTLSVRPLDWSRSSLVLAPGATPDWDGVEGFWIARPWLTEETCPRVAGAAADPVPQPTVADDSPAAVQPDDAAAPSVPSSVPAPLVSPQTMGLAAIRAADSSRLGRRNGSAYSFVVRGGADAPPVVPQQGYRLVLGGRFGAFPDGRVVHCTARSPEQRPVCIAAVELDLVAFEDAAGGRLSEWRLN